MQKLNSSASGHAIFLHSGPENLKKCRPKNSWNFTELPSRFGWFDEFSKANIGGISSSPWNKLEPPEELTISEAKCSTGLNFLLPAT